MHTAVQPAYCRSDKAVIMLINKVSVIKVDHIIVSIIKLPMNLRDGSGEVAMFQQQQRGGTSKHVQQSNLAFNFLFKYYTDSEISFPVIIASLSLSENILKILFSDV